MDKNTTDTPPYLAGVIGHPISHSKSPKLHNYWLSKYNINGFYIPFSVTTDKLQASIKSLIGLGFNGVNVTIPHKTNVLSFADWRAAPETIGSADLLINATSMGMIGQPEFSQPISRAKKTALVIDIVYNPLVTELLKEATKLKLKTVGGIGMLINQAVPGFEHWFQKSPVIDDEIRKFIVE